MEQDKMVQKKRALTKIKEKIQIPGYILDSESIKRIDNISRQAIKVNKDSEEDKIEISIWGTTEEGDSVEFESIDSINTYLDTENKVFNSLSLQYISAEEAGIRLVFKSDGTITLSAFGNIYEFRFKIDRLISEIIRCDQNYSWLVRRLVFPIHARFFLVMLSGFFSFILLRDL